MVPHGDRIDSAKSRTVQHQGLRSAFRTEQNIVGVFILNHYVDNAPLRMLRKTPRNHFGKRSQMNNQRRNRGNW